MERKEGKKGGREGGKKTHRHLAVAFPEVATYLLREDFEAVGFL